jgi:hypothetical protein
MDGGQQRQARERRAVREAQESQERAQARERVRVAQERERQEQQQRATASRERAERRALGSRPSPPQGTPREGDATTPPCAEGGAPAPA